MVLTLLVCVAVWRSGTDPGFLTFTGVGCLCDRRNFSVMRNRIRLLGWTCRSCKDSWNWRRF